MFRNISVVVTFVLLILSFNVSGNTQCRPLIQFSFSAVALSDNERLRLTELLYQRLTPDTRQSAQYDVIQELCKPYTQITLSDVPSRYPEKFQSAYELDPIPAFAQFTLPDSKPDTSLIAQRKRPYSLVMDAPTYPADDDQTAITLLLNGKVDGVIDYADNIPLYETAVDDLIISLIHAKTPIYLLFEQAAFRDAFDRLSSAHFSNNRSGAESVNAGAAAPTIRWMVLNKYFSQKRKALIALDAERRVITWLDEQLDDFTFLIEETNSSDAMAQISENANVCAFGVYQTPARARFALFSSPAIYYFSPRLYLRKGTLPDTTRAAFTDDQGVLDATALLTEWDKLAIGYTPEMLTLVSPVSDLLVAQPRRFFAVDALERERMLALFEKGRLDGFINFPSHLIQARKHVTTLPDVESYTIASEPIIGHARAACSKSDTGRAVMSAIEATLTDPALRFQYMSLLTDGMLMTEKRIFHTAAGTLKQFDAASAHKTTTSR